MKKILSIILVFVMVLSFVACTDEGSEPKVTDPEGSEPVENVDPEETEAPSEAPSEDPSEEPSEAPTEPEAGTVQGVTDTEVLVGNVAGTSGALVGVGVPFNAGIEAYFDMVNAEGGVAGRQIRFIHQDDESDPAKAKAAVQTLVEDEKIFAMVGHFGTPSIMATLDDLKGYGIPVVYFASGVNTLFNEEAEGADRNIFPVQPILITEGQIMIARAVADFGAETVGVIYTNDDAGKDMVNGAEAMGERLGITVVAEQVTAGATDVSAAVTAVLNANPDVVIAATIQPTLPAIVKGLVAQGNEAPVITSYNNVDGQIASQIFPDIAGQFDVYGNGWLDVTQESAAEDFANFATYIGDDYATSAFAMAGWIAGQTFTAGLEAVGEAELTWESYIDALDQEQVRIPWGGYVDFTDGKRVGVDSMNMSRLADESTWEAYKPLQSIDEILASVD